MSTSFIVKGITYQYRFPHSTEGSGSVWQSVFFAYLCSLIYERPFYFYPNYINRHGETTPYEIFSENWNNIFNFIIEKSTKLDFLHDQLIIPYEDLHKFRNLSHPAIANMGFQTALTIFKDHYKYFNQHYQQIIIRDYHALNKFKPSEHLFVEDDFNIAIHLRTIEPEDVYGDNDNKKLLEFQKDSKAIPGIDWQFFNIDYGEANQNTNFYSKLYSSLLNRLVEEAGKTRDLKKRIVVHIFSRGDAGIFTDLISRINPRAEVKLHNMMSVEDTFFYLTKAGALICAQSSLSCLASFLNPAPSFIRVPVGKMMSANTYFFNDDLNFVHATQFYNGN